MSQTPVTVVGTLVSDTRPRRVGPDGMLVLNFRIASNERRFDRASESWVDGESLYLSVSCWRGLAENAASLVKGDPVIVSGRLRTREWITDRGERRSVVEMEANAIGPDLARCTATVRRRRRTEPVSVEAPAPEELDPEELDSEDLIAEDLDPEALEEIGSDGFVPREQTDLSELARAARPLVPA